MATDYSHFWSFKTFHLCQHITGDKLVGSPGNGARALVCFKGTLGENNAYLGLRTTDGDGSE